LVNLEQATSVVSNPNGDIVWPMFKVTRGVGIDWAVLPWW
jgi:hypothetical protein